MFNNSDPYDEKTLRAQNGFRGFLDENKRYSRYSSAPAKPVASVGISTITPLPPQPLNPPYVVQVEIPCEDCGGSGRDLGTLDPFEYEPCSHCNGRGKETITRNYLSEAFGRISNPDSTRVVERGHLIALAQYLSNTVQDAHAALGALKTFLPEVA